MRKKSLAISFLCGLCLSFSAMADPWLDTGSAALRHDVQLLADWGVIRRPVTTWPLSAPDIAEDLMVTRRIEGLAPHKMVVVRRVRSVLQRMAQKRLARPAVGIAVAADDSPLRTFENTPRAEAEVSAEVSGLGGRWAYRLRYTQVVDPDDEKENRLDESYVAMRLGNWMLGVGSQSRWWGPGWDGSLILSNNARPVPSVFFQRKTSTPFETRWLSWMGPWQLTGFLGQKESERFIENARLFGMRLNFRPTPNLEVGLSRTAQWAGRGRPNDFSSFVKLLGGQADNNDGGGSTADEPGNQLAGYDFRYVLNRFELPLAIYGQFIGEDEAGGLPSKFVKQVGLEGWVASSENLQGTLRWRVEWVDTSITGDDSAKFNTAYEHSTYRSGYRYYGSNIAHALDNDSRMLSVGAIYNSIAGKSYQLIWRSGELNRDGANRSAPGGNPLSPNGGDFWRLDWMADWPLTESESLQFGLGYNHIEGAVDDASDVGGYVRWKQAF